MPSPDRSVKLSIEYFEYSCEVNQEVPNARTTLKGTNPTLIKEFSEYNRICAWEKEDKEKWQRERN